MLLSKTLFLLVVLVATSCAFSVHQNHIADFSPYFARGRGKLVHADVKEFVVLSDFSRAAFVDKAYQELLASCPQGDIASVSTLHSTALGFFSWHNRLRLQGLCVPKG